MIGGCVGEGGFERYAGRRAGMEKLWGEYSLNVEIPEVTYKTSSEVLRKVRESADRWRPDGVEDAKCSLNNNMASFLEGSLELKNKIVQWVALGDLIEDFEYILDKYIR
jgi:hypothetical protein